MIIETLAPKTQLEETPKVEGVAISFDKVVCIISPATLNPAPQIIEARTRGILIFKITRLLISSL